MSSVDLIAWDDRGGAMVERDGHPQSYVHPDDPGLLAFEYVQHLAIGLDTLPAGRVGVTHIGGAGLTLPRYLQHTRPGSAQIVLEPDVLLTDMVRAELPLPRGHRIRVRPQDGATGLAGMKDDAADAIVVDAFDAGRVPADLVGADAMAQYARVLSGGGLLLMNLTDDKGLRWAARVTATAVGAGLDQVAWIGTHEVLKHKRFGNVVLLASDRPLDEPTLARRASGCAFPTGVRTGAALRTLLSGTTALPASGERSPVPPEAGRWSFG